MLTRTARPDPELIDLIGQRLRKRDEVGAALVAAMRTARDGDRVYMGQFKEALEHGVDAVPDCPNALRAFFAEVERVPAWVDWDLLNEGAAAYRRLGTNAADVMLQLSADRRLPIRWSHRPAGRNRGSHRTQDRAAPRRDPEVGGGGIPA